VVKLGNRLSELQEKLQEKRGQVWHPKEHGITLKDLRQAFESWEKGTLPEEDYLFGLIESNKEFLSEFLKDIQKIRKINSHLSDDLLMEWISKFKDLKLEIDSAEAVDAVLKIRGCLRRVLALVTRTEPSKHHNIAGKIVEEVIAWNRKKLNQEEYGHLLAEMDTLKNLEHFIDTKDFDWTHFQAKMVCYQWRQLARFVQEDPSSTKETIQDLLRSAPKELKVQKINEWTNLVSKAKDVEWMEEKKIHDRLTRYLDDHSLISKMGEVSKFINDAYICLSSDETCKSVETFEKAITIYRTNEIDSIDQLEQLVKDMIECKFYQTNLFEYFDGMQRKIQLVKSYAVTIEKIKKKMLEDKKDTPTDTPKVERLSFQDVTDLLESLEKIPKQIIAEVSTNLDKIKLEINLFTEFLQSVEPECRTTIKRLAEVLTGLALEDVQKYQESLLKDYRSQFVFKDSGLEDLLAKISVLIKGCCMLQEGLSSTELGTAAMDNELEPAKPKNSQTSAPYKEIVTWESVLSDVRNACKDVLKSAPIIEEITEPLETAKKFMQVVHNIGNGQPTITNRLIELKDVKQLVAERRNGSEKIKLEESLQFLEEIIQRAEEVEVLLHKEKVDLSDLKEALTFMQRVGIQFNQLIELCQFKISKAEKFIESFKSLQKENLEKEFEHYTEEYNSLNITITEIEASFNVIQECHNLCLEAERLMVTEDFDLQEILDVKIRLSHMKYFKSTTLLASVMCKLFYKMREVYEQSDEEQTFVIEYNQLCKLIAEAQQIIGGKGKEDIRSSLKEKLAMVNQIFKDVSTHLNKHVYSQSLKSLIENKPANIFRNFVDISVPIAEHIKGLEAIEENHKEKPVPAVEKRKEELEKLVPREVITNEVRDGFIKVCKENLLANKYFNFSPKEASTHAKGFEKEVYTKYQTNPSQYEKLCEEINRVLKEIVHYNHISQSIKSKKFCVKSVSDYFGKSSFEIRHLNYAMDKSLNQKPGENTKVEMGEEPIQKKISVHKKIDSEEEPKTQDGNFDNMVVGEYQYYRLYIGDLFIQHQEVVKLEKVQLMTCSKAKVISQFSVIPRELTLSTKCSVQSFTEYMNKLMTLPPNKIKILPGFLVPSGNSEKLNKLSSLLKENNLVASKTYSERCKLFIFPRDILPKDWLDNINIVTMVKDVDLLFFLVWKIPDVGIENSHHTTITPEPMPIAGGKAYKLVFNNKVRDHNISIEFLKESKMLEKSLPEHMRSKIGHANPAVDPLSTTMQQKGHMDMVKNAEEGVNKLIKSYSKAVSSMGAHHSGSFYSNPASEGMSLGTKHDTYGRDSHRDHEETSLLKRFTHPRLDVTSIDPPIDTLTHKKSPTFENDLLGALQNVKPSRPFQRQTGSFGQHHTSGHSYSNKTSEHLGSTNTYSEIPSYSQSILGFQGENNLPRMLNKRPPIVSNPPSLLSSTIAQPSIGHHLSAISNHNDNFINSAPSERKTFLQQAISAIQIPAPGAGSTHISSGTDQKLHHSALGKKNPNLGYGIKPASRPTDLRSTLNASHEVAQSHSVEQHYKKKPSNSGNSAFPGTMPTQGYHPMPFDNIKNQFF
jgi:hypothetical protein